MPPASLLPDFLAMFITLAGYVVGLGAVTVIEFHAWFARHSHYWTEATTRTHKITKPLIWIGLAQVILGSAFLYRDTGLTPLTAAQLFIGVILVGNGAFLTFRISPLLLRKERAGRSNALLAARWQQVVFWSFVLSYVGWWGSIALFAWYLVTPH